MTKPPDYTKQTCATLRTELKTRGLLTGGVKGQLICRLQSSDRALAREPSFSSATSCWSALTIRQLREEFKLRGWAYSVTRGTKNSLVRKLTRKTAYHPPLFPFFTLLPPEIRIKIWTLSLPSPRAIPVSCNRYPRCYAPLLYRPLNPAALAVNYESRSLALERYKACLRDDTGVIYADFEGGDYLYFGDWVTNPCFLYTPWYGSYEIWWGAWETECIQKVKCVAFGPNVWHKFNRPPNSFLSLPTNIWHSKYFKPISYLGGLQEIGLAMIEEYAGFDRGSGRGEGMEMLMTDAIGPSDEELSLAVNADPRILRDPSRNPRLARLAALSIKFVFENLKEHEWQSKWFSRCPAIRLVDIEITDVDKSHRRRQRGLRGRTRAQIQESRSRYSFRETRPVSMGFFLRGLSGLEQRV